MKKLTNVTALEMVLALEVVVANEELTEKLTAMKNQFAKKNASDGKPTKNQMANNLLKETIVEVLGRYEEPKAIKDLQHENEEIGLDKYSNQKISALMRQLVTENTVVRTEEKRVAHFHLI